ncbi:PREDICTED: protein DEHYDRATION-INDUCED 19 homolog 6-like [Brassica oleracea var. oleracea]|uniref:Drought induced 19 protein type zinc-binding domain-containing protein n=1 Tax=Brassica oleracea var. oleracea TaxID=109376 RepID=A0A0D3AXC4_BRAOL|nr:PREDICTED: protein DEHYDRATION-INDUCED 19 homolog 6-like [Brassica oleracea var. oleracea]
MDSDSWSDRLASASRRYQLDFLSRSDNFLGFEEAEGEEEFREEYACPFCSDYFDIVSLCCHIDENHPMDTINGVCPVCAVKVSSDMVAHITLQHANMFKVTTRKRKSTRRGGAQSMLSILKREFPDGNFQSLFEGSSRVVVPPSSSSTAADPLLSSFISPLADGLFISESSSAKKTSNQSFPERSVEKKSLSAEDHREKLKQSEFVQGIFSSMILDDDL